jgi:hypothetical protein
MLKFSELKQASTVSRVLHFLNSEYPCAVLSAYLYMDPDTGVLVSLEENKTKQGELMKDLQQQGYGFFPLRAKFKENDTISEEESLCVPKMSFDEAVKMGQKYRQFSVLAKDENGIFGEVNTRNNVGEWIRIFNPKNTKISEEDFVGAFSQLMRGNPNAKRKRIQLAYLAELTPRNIVPIRDFSRYAVQHVFVKEK